MRSVVFPSRYLVLPSVEGRPACSRALDFLANGPPFRKAINLSGLKSHAPKPAASAFAISLNEKDLFTKNRQQSPHSSAGFAFPKTVTDPQAKASVLIKALPYLQRFRGKTFLIKIGGSVMEDPALVSEFMRDILFLEVAGIHPILVHGGGTRLIS